MTRFPGGVYSQSVIILGSGSNSYPRSLEEVSIESIYPAEEFGLVFWQSFAATPAIWDYELAQYQELGEALSELSDFAGDDDWMIEEPVYEATCFIAAELMLHGIPAPRFFTHGSKSVVFQWTSNTENLYLTVSSNSLSALIASPQTIMGRLDYTQPGLLGSGHALETIQAAFWNPAKQLRRGTTPPKVDLYLPVLLQA